MERKKQLDYEDSEKTMAELFKSFFFKTIYHKMAAHFSLLLIYLLEYPGYSSNSSFQQ